jgi:RimJ/RimL family protein N-acetyltransferase
MHTTAPTVTTARLTLRAHTRADYDRMHAMWTHPKVYEFISGKPSSPQDTWFRLMRHLGHWTLLGFGGWAVCETNSGQCIGDVGLADYKRGLHVDFDGVPEAGWVLMPEAFGRGYATEAMQACLNWYGQTFGPTRMVCMISKDHNASIGVARKLGFQAFAAIDSNGPVQLFERRAADTAT